MSTHKKMLLALLMMAAAVTGCATSKGGDVYSRDEARRPITVRMATVEAIRAVKLEGNKAIGIATGAAVGGIAGGSVANDKRGQAIGAVLGAVVGGVIGAASEEMATREEAVEITVRLEDKSLLAIVQGGKVEEFKVGDKVRLLGSGNETRVSY